MRFPERDAMKTFPKRFPVLPQFDEDIAEPSPASVFGAPAALAPVAAESAVLARQKYRRSPFYLKIDGLTGPRPRYDEAGRLIPDA